MTHSQFPTDVIDRTQRVGLVGVGSLGGAMAEALLRDGWLVTLFDRDRARASALRSAGAECADSIEELSSCVAVAVVVPGEPEVQEVIEGPGGLLDSLADGATIVLHSTLPPNSVMGLEQKVSARGLRLLDAPVSGGEERARLGDLTVMVGGDTAVLEAVGSLLESLGSQIIHLGPAGAGSATKLANQLMLFANLSGVIEALDLAEAYGVSETSVLQTVGSSLGESWVTRNWGFFENAKTAYDQGNTRVEDRPWSKDLWEILVAGRSAGVALPHAALLAQSLAERVESRGEGNRRL